MRFQMKATPEAIDETNYELEELAYNICNQHMISGECFWALVECYAVTKQMQLSNQLTY